MEPLNEELVENIDRYVEDLFVPPDTALSQNLRDAEAAGLPPIQVSPNQGKLLYLLVKLAGAKRVLEIGTLGGYSTTWLARALPSDGTLITLEREAKHAEVARENLRRAGLSSTVDIRLGAASDSLRTLICTGTGPFDVVFIDADKAGYVEYLELALQLTVQARSSWRTTSFATDWCSTQTRLTQQTGVPATTTPRSRAIRDWSP